MGSDVVEIIAFDGDKEKKVIINKRTLTASSNGLIFFLSREKDRRMFLKHSKAVLDRASGVLLKLGGKAFKISRRSGAEVVKTLIEMMAIRKRYNRSPTNKTR